MNTQTANLTSTIDKDGFAMPLNLKLSCDISTRSKSKVDVKIDDNSLISEDDSEGNT